MKTLIFVLLAISSIASAKVSSKGAPIPTDEDHIKKMAGCYDVTFDFKETLLRDTDYPITSPDYTESGLEWIEIDREATGRIDLQHVLLTVMGPIKHWRQEWTKAPTHIWEYKGRLNFFDKNSPLLWQKIETSGDPLAWGQRVLQVDDSPRYDCAARWQPIADTYVWECNAPGPLPRREFSIRDDYDILQRTNRHFSNADGWKHEQFNLKTQSQGPTVLAEEVGNNTYKKVPNERCNELKDWWSKNKTVWHFIQEEWTKVLNGTDTLKLVNEVNDEPLWRTLSLWAQTHRDEKLTDIHRAEVQKIISDFRVP